MWWQTFKHLPLHLGGAGMLVFTTAAAAAFFLTHPSKVSNGTTRMHGRALPLVPIGATDRAAPLREAVAALTVQRQETDQRLSVLKNETVRLREEIAHRQAVMLKQQEVAGKVLPEEQALLARLQDPPQWQTLGLEDRMVSQLKSAWESPATEKLQEENAALSLLGAQSQALHKEATQKQSEARASTGKQRSFLVALKKDVQKAREELVASLDLSLFKEEEVMALKKAIQDLMQGSLRVALGKNFINSAGMEMVWVPFKDSGFWIARSEVKMSSFSKVSPAEGGSCSSDDEGYVYRVLWKEADDFCRRLTQREKAGSVPEAGQLSPEGWAYGLPSTGHLTYARKTSSVENLGLLNLQSGGAEWVTNPSTTGGFRTLWQKNSGEGSLLAVPDNRDHVVVSDAGANKGIRRDYYDGKVGFRVILVPEGAQ